MPINTLIYCDHLQYIFITHDINQEDCASKNQTILNSSSVQNKLFPTEKQTNFLVLGKEL